MDEMNLADVLEEYALNTGAENDQSILRRLMEKYPQFAEDLMDFAAARAVVRYAPDAEISADDEAKYKEFGLNNLRRVLSRTNKKSAVMASLTDAAKAKGLNKLKFADALGVSLSLVMYLENKRLEFASIPKAIIKKIAEVLETGENAVAEFLDQMPNAAAGASYKTDTRPEEIKPKNFAEAVREDQQLSAEQKRKLLDPEQG